MLLPEIAEGLEAALRLAWMIANRVVGYYGRIRRRFRRSSSKNNRSPSPPRLAIRNNLHDYQFHPFTRLLNPSTTGCI